MPEEERSQNSKNLEKVIKSLLETIKREKYCKIFKCQLP